MFLLPVFKPETANKSIRFRAIFCYRDIRCSRALEHPALLEPNAPRYLCGQACGRVRCLFATMQKPPAQIPWLARHQGGFNCKTKMHQAILRGVPSILMSKRFRIKPSDTLRLHANTVRLSTAPHSGLCTPRHIDRRFVLARQLLGKKTGAANYDKRLGPGNA